MSWKSFGPKKLLQPRYSLAGISIRVLSAISDNAWGVSSPREREEFLKTRVAELVPKLADSVVKSAFKKVIEEEQK
jgi:hypothetical protein